MVSLSNCHFDIRTTETRRLQSFWGGGGWREREREKKKEREEGEKGAKKRGEKTTSPRPGVLVPPWGRPPWGSGGKAPWGVGGGEGVAFPESTAKF